MKKLESTTYLVIDDSKVTRQIITTELEKCGVAKVVEAGDGVEGLKKLREYPEVGMILCDINMPHMSGIEFLQEVRSNEKHNEVTIIMVTTEKCKESVIKAIALGANDYLTKPFERSALMEKILCNLE